MRFLHLLSVVLGHLMIFAYGYNVSKEYSDKDILSVLTVLVSNVQPLSKRLDTHSSKAIVRGGPVRCEVQ